MATDAKELTVGPWPGGKNSLLSPTDIDNDELVACQNFDIQADGTLMNRPAVWSLTSTGSLSPTGTAEMLGLFIYNNITYAIITLGANTYMGIVGNATSLSSTNGLNQAAMWTKIASFAAADFILFGGIYLYLTGSGTNNPGNERGYYNMSTATYTSLATGTGNPVMPAEGRITTFKNRMYITAPGASGYLLNRVNYTDPYNGTNGATAFNSSNYGAFFFDLNANDSEAIVDIYGDEDVIYIFRSDSIWAFTYATSPTQGVLTKVTGEVGAGNNWRNIVKTPEGDYYLFYNLKAYLFRNGKVYQINKKRPFVNYTAGPTTSWDTSVSYFDGRIIFRQRTRYYVYYPDTGAWVDWVYAITANNPELFFSTYLPGNEYGQVFGVALPASRGTTGVRMLYSETLDRQTVFGQNEAMTCVLETKHDQIGDPSKWKRLFWWGVDIMAGSIATITGSTRYYGRSDSPTYNTDAFLATDFSSALDGTRKFLKIGSGRRGRVFGFVLSIPVTGPGLQIFSIRAWLSVKGKTAREVF